MLHAVRPAATCRRQNFPRLVGLIARLRHRQVLHCRFSPAGASLLVRHAAYPRDIRISKGETIVQQLAQFLTVTGRRLRTLGKVICHFFRKGKVGHKLAINIPFFVEAEASFETDWNRRE
jgi:hypothetical protein